MPAGQTCAQKLEYLKVRHFFQNRAPTIFTQPRFPPRCATRLVEATIGYGKQWATAKDYQVDSNPCQASMLHSVFYCLVVPSQDLSTRPCQPQPLLRSICDHQPSLSHYHLLHGFVFSCSMVVPYEL